MMTAPIWCYSQNTLTITSDQLRTTNLIFAEHKQLTETVPLLNQQITNLELINKSWERTDSIHKVRTVQLEKTITDAEKSIIDLQKSLKKKQNTIKYGTAGSVLIILCLLLM